MLISTISSTYGLNPADPQFGVILTSVVLHFSGAISAHEMQHRMNTVLTRGCMSAQKFRLMLGGNRYVLSCVKAFAVRLAKAKQPNSETVNMLWRQLKVERVDAFWLTSWFRADSEYRRQLKAHAKTVDNDSLDHRKVDEQLRRVYSPFRKYLTYIVWKRIRFLAKSENMSLEDLASRVEDEVLPKFLKEAPFDTDAYALNYLKKVASCRVHNVRDHFNAQKRQRLVEEGFDKNGERRFSMMTVAESQMRVTHTSEGDVEVSLEDMGPTDNSMAKFELSFSVSQLLETVKGSSRRSLILSILMGHENPKFTQWLIDEGYASKAEDNHDVQQRVDPGVFIKYIAHWLDVPLRSVQAFINKTKVHLGALQTA